MFYAKSTGGFYDPTIHTTIPDDAVEISADRHQTLLAAQSTGKHIKADADGHPIAIDLPTPTTADLLIAVRRERNARLRGCDWTQLSDSPLTGTDRAAWVAYRKALRDFPATCDPAAPVWPEEPPTTN